MIKPRMSRSSCIPSFCTNGDHRIDRCRSFNLSRRAVGQVVQHRRGGAPADGQTRCMGWGAYRGTPPELSSRGPFRRRLYSVMQRRARDHRIRSDSAICMGSRQRIIRHVACSPPTGKAVQPRARSRSILFQRNGRLVVPDHTDSESGQCGGPTEQFGILSAATVNYISLTT